jgi:hypothetical protein
MALLGCELGRAGNNVPECDDFGNRPEFAEDGRSSARVIVPLEVDVDTSRAGRSVLMKQTIQRALANFRDCWLFLE